MRNIIVREIFDVLIVSFLMLTAVTVIGSLLMLLYVQPLYMFLIIAGLVIFIAVFIWAITSMLDGA